MPVILPPLLVLMLTLTAPIPSVSAQPQMLAYSATPTSYFNEHATEVARLYDGFFFIAGDWDEGIAQNIGLGEEEGHPDPDWLKNVAENIRNLTAAGVTESILGVSFPENGVWPSPQTLLSAEFTNKMARHFGRLARAAQENGFRGISIDVEYPYKRYSFDHEIYQWDGYTVEDLLRAAETQGRATMTAILDAYPDTVVFLLPGDPRDRPICRAYVKGLLAVMAERNAPGGMHLGNERGYCLFEGPVSQIALCRDGDLAMEWLWRDNAQVRRYWKEYCSVAPGVWPLHMVETGGKDYPVRPWPDELADLRSQLQTLRLVARRYIWSFSAAPLWGPANLERYGQYGIHPPAFENAEEVVRTWQEILADKTTGTDPRAERLIQAVQKYDAGTLSATDLCAIFGTPPDWYVLGPLGNPFTKPQFAALQALTAPIRLDIPVQGRDYAVHWFPYQSRMPLGTVSMSCIFDWRNTDDQAAHLVTEVYSPAEQPAWINVGWDDGIRIWLGSQCVFDRSVYPPQGHGALFRDRFLFEERVEVKIPSGTTRLGVTTINSHGKWSFSLRITDANGFPIEGITFRLPDDE